MSQQNRLGKLATTVCTMDNGDMVITYHSTPVVTKKANGSIVLNTGGWFTATTKTRMNQASHQFNLGYQVCQKAGNWFASWKGKEIPFDGSILVLE